MKILIPCVATTSVIRWNRYDIKILWLIGLIFELRIGLVFQYTQLQLRSWFTNYICILNTIFTTDVQKDDHLSEDVNNLWLIFDFCKKCGFSVFLTIFQCYNHRFLPNFTKSYSKMQIVHNKFILKLKSITVLVWCLIFVVKECFFYCKLRINISTWQALCIHTSPWAGA